MRKPKARRGKKLKTVKEFAILSRRIVRRPEVLRLTGLSTRTVDRLEAAGAFPKRVQLTSHSVGWRLHEVMKWIDTRPRGFAEEPFEPLDDDAILAELEKQNAALV